MASQTTTAFQSSEINYRSIFNALPGNSYLLQNNAPHFTILAATSGILNLSALTRKDLLGKGMFENFPSNQDDPNDTVENNLRASLLYVISSKKAHQLPIQRYDVMDATGEFIERYWKAENTPVFDRKGDVAFIIHTTEDIIKSSLKKWKNR